VSFLLAFHPVSRHDGVVSVMRGFRPAELHAVVRSALGRDADVRNYRGFRIAAAWTPDRRDVARPAEAAIAAAI
jgi:hypothetical protein